jgi:hypothetical protein
VDAGTGLKKWSPTKLAGRWSCAARSVTESEEVFEARNAPAASCSSTAFRALTFSSKSSGTASTTRPQLANAA